MAKGLKKPDPNEASGLVNEEQRRAAELVRANKERQRQALHLQRENILSQRTSNPNRRTALEAALVQIESQIETLA
jgi:hypothetical protein